MIDGLTAQKARSGRIVYLVLNKVIGDSRVIKTAVSAVHLGFSAAIIGITSKAEEERFIIDGVDVILLPKRLLNKIKQCLRSKEDIYQACRMFAETLNALNPVLLHTHDTYGLAFGANMLRHTEFIEHPIPWVHDVHEFTPGIEGIDDPSKSFLLELEERYMKEPDYLITVSPALADLLVDHYRLARSPFVTYNCPNLASHRLDYYPRIRDALGLPEATPLIIWVGRVNQFRGTHTAVEAALGISDAHFVILTNQSTDYTKKLEQLAERLNARKRFHILDYVPVDEVTSYISGADLGMHAGTHDLINMQIAMPNKLFEYIHASIPIVVSDVGTMSEFVSTHGIGEIFKAGDPSSARQAIKKVLGAKHTYAVNLTDKLREEYSWEAQTETLDLIYTTALDEYRPRVELTNIEECRIVHGYTGAAGQSWATAEAQRQIGLNASCVHLFKTNFGYPSDFSIYIRTPIDSAYALARLSRKYDVFHIYARGIYFSWSDKPNNFLDLIQLRLRGKIIIYNFRGSEARLHGKFAEVNRFHWTEDEGNSTAKHPEYIQQLIVENASKFANKVTVIDPELQTYIPDATIVPRAISLNQWDYVGVSDRDRPVLVHAPTNRSIKGTEYIIAALDELKDEGLEFDFQLIENMSNDEAKQKYRNADIVIDQLRAGWYGVLAVEAMALGKAVVSYIREDLLHELPADLPLANASPDTVKGVLRQLIEQKDRRVSLGKAARVYCEMTHDAHAIAVKYRDIYQEALIANKPLSMSSISSYLSRFANASMHAPAKARQTKIKASSDEGSVMAGRPLGQRLRLALERKILFRPYRYVPLRIMYMLKDFIRRARPK